MCYRRDYKASHDNIFLPFFFQLLKKKKNKAVPFFFFLFFPKLYFWLWQISNDILYLPPTIDIYRHPLSNRRIS